MDVKDAVLEAKKYIVQLFEDEEIVNVGLEEAYLDQKNHWQITIGFSRPWDRNIESVLGGQWSRSYKVVTIDNHGRVSSIKDRPLTKSS